jgi:hypothetical protein
VKSLEVSEGAAMVEFASTDTRAWIAALEAYGQRLEALGNPKLTALDTFYRVELPELLEKRQADAYITQEELTKIMQWKLSRGKWRCVFFLSQSGFFLGITLSPCLTFHAAVFCRDSFLLLLLSFRVPICGFCSQIENPFVYSVSLSLPWCFCSMFQGFLCLWL